MAQTKAEIVIAAIDEVTGVVNKIEGGVDRLSSNVKSIIGGLSFGYLVKQFLETSDAMTLMNARLKLVTGSTDEFNSARSEAYRIAQANNIGLQEAATLYTRLAEPVQRLGGSTKEVSGIVEAFATSLRVGGASAQEASAATLQFAQAMASGKLQGDEFRSIAEASPRFMRALADGMGVPIERLKEMSKEGKLTADVVGNALMKSLAGLKDEAGSLPDTVGGAMQRLKNDAMLFVEQIDTATNASAEMAEVVGGVSSIVGEFGRAVNFASAEMEGSAEQFDLTAVAIGAVGTVLETLVVVFANVAYVAKTTATEISVWYQQAKLVLKGQFDEAKRVGDEWARQAEENRKAIDNFSSSVTGATSRVLQQRDALKNHSISAKENSNEIARLASRSGVASGEFKKLTSTLKDNDTQQKANKKSADEYEKAAKAVLELTSKSLGVNADYTEKLKALELWYSKNRDRTSEYVVAVTQLINQQPMVVEWQKKQADELKRTEEAQKKAIEQYIKAHDAAEDLVAGYEAEVAAMQATGSEREIQIALLKIEATGVDKTSAAYVEYEQRIREAVGTIEAQKASKEAAETSAKGWQDAAKQIEQALTDALVQGFGNGKSIVKSIGEWIINWFKTTIARGIAQALSGAIMAGLSSIANAVGLGGSVGGAAGGAAGGLGNLGNLGSIISSLFGEFGAGLTGSLTGGIGLGTGLELITSGASVAGGIGVLAPYAAAAAGLYALITGWGTGRQRDPATQSTSFVDSSGNAISQNWYPTPNLTSSTAYVDVLRGVTATINEIVGKLGGTAGNLNFGLMTSTSPDGLGGQVVATVADAVGRLIYNYNVNGPNDTVDARLAENLPRLIAAGLAESDFGDEVNKIFDSLNLNTVTADQLAAAIAQAEEIKAEQDAPTDTADAVQENTIILRDNSEVLEAMRDLMRELLAASRDGFNDVAGATRDSGARVADAVLALADRPIEVMMPEVNGGA